VEGNESHVTGQLQDRVAVITGGTRGIGRAIADAFLAEGAYVVMSGRSPEKGKRAVEEMGRPDRTWFVAGDARSQQDTEALIDEAAGHFGGVDVLVNNAGGSDGFALVHELSDAAWENALAWNLNSTFWATRRALPHMLENQWGRVIAISSVESKQANKPMVSHYITNKHAINGFVKAVAFEYGPSGITSNAICPGVVETDLTRDAGATAAQAMGITYEEFLKGYAEDSMIKRINTSAEVAAVAVLLASEVGGGITGALLNVDGGTSSW
jgi:NAD(P)-dependent dehydrogenase (short-subunit alcohol dehydrogenase family)